MKNMVKKQWIIFIAILLFAIAVPTTAFAAAYGPLTGGTVFAGNDPDPGSNGIKSDNAPSTWGDFDFDFTNNNENEPVSAVITIPVGYTVTQIVVKGATNYVVYTGSWIGPTTVEVNNAELPNNPSGKPPAISHITVWYTSTPTDPKIDITGTKVWVADPGTQYPDITLNLYNDVATAPVASHTLEADDYTGLDTWQYTFTGLPSTDGNGHTYVYRIDESSVPDGYDKSISRDGLTVTNTQQERQTVDIPVTKIWAADPGTDYPNITLYLYNDIDSAPVASHVLYADDYTGDNWEYTFTDFPATDGNGHTYIYTIDESSVPDGYDKSISDDGLTITNTQQERETIDIPVTKVWRGRNPGPDVTVDVYLVIDDEVTRNKITLSADNDWTGMFEGLEPGLNYSVVEDAEDIPGRFTSSVSGNVENGFTITNRYHEPPDEDDDEDEEDEIPEPEVPLDELPDTEVPLDETPQTGDNMNGSLPLVLAAFSLISLGAMRYLSRSES
jgi:hypothetical protein